jgi:hypothetical protein
MCQTAEFKRVLQLIYTASMRAAFEEADYFLKREVMIGASTFPRRRWRDPSDFQPVLLIRYTSFCSHEKHLGEHLEILGCIFESSL